MSATATAVEASQQIPTVPGTPYGGGFYAGRFFLAERPCVLIVSPKAAGEIAPMSWNDSLDRVAGAAHYADGLANTLAMAAAGSELAKQTLALRIGGFEDWYIWSRLEALMAFHELAKAPGFVHGDPETFERDFYWTSTQSVAYADSAYGQYFDDGGQDGYRKSGKYHVRAVRREFI